MRINRLLAFNKWIPTIRTMPPMLKELYQHPEKGFLGGEFSPTGKTGGAAVLAVVRGAGAVCPHPHLPTWRRFNQLVGTDRSIGIWHESYLVEADHYEAIYDNMSIFGLAKATEHVPARGRLETTRRRLRRGENEPAVPSPE